MRTKTHLIGTFILSCTGVMGILINNLTSTPDQASRAAGEGEHSVFTKSRHPASSHRRDVERATVKRANPMLAGESPQVRAAFEILLTSFPADSYLLRQSLSHLFKVQPEVAVKLACLLLESSSTSAGIPEVAKDWNSQELNLALAWLSELPAGDLSAAWLNKLSRFYVEIDPQQALALLPRFNTAERQSECLIQIMDRWAEMDCDGAMKHLAAMPADELRKAAEQAILIRLTETTPAAAATYVAAHMEPDSAAQKEATRQVVSRWAYLDPSAAAQWLGLFPDTPLRDEMAGILLPVWSESDPAAAQAWSSHL